MIYFPVSTPASRRTAIQNEVFQDALTIEVMCHQAATPLEPSGTALELSESQEWARASTARRNASSWSFDLYDPEAQPLLSRLTPHSTSLVNNWSAHLPHSLLASDPPALPSLFSSQSADMSDIMHLLGADEHRSSSLNSGVRARLIVSSSSLKRLQVRTIPPCA